MRFLSGGSATLREASQDGKVLVEAAGRGTIALDRDLLDRLVAQGLLIRASHSVALSQEGALLAQRLSASRKIPGRDVGVISVETSAGPAVALANLSESPLGQLVRRKTKAGAPFLTAREFEAGERLRADYTRGQLMPRLGANWVASVASGKRAGSGGIAELTDAALGARLRVEKAIAAVGPELAGVLIDVCCFLKGLELVETERGWPVRSAKIVLKTALGALARHYFPDEVGPKPCKRRMLHWAVEDYRPKITG